MANGEFRMGKTERPLIIRYSAFAIQHSIAAGRVLEPAGDRRPRQMIAHARDCRSRISFGGARHSPVPIRRSTVPRRTEFGLPAHSTESPERFSPRSNENGICWAGAASNRRHWHDVFFGVWGLKAWKSFTGRMLSERGGFEPPVPFRAHWFSKPAPSATRAPLLRSAKRRQKPHSPDAVLSTLGRRSHESMVQPPGS